MFKYIVEYRTAKYHRSDIWHYHNAFKIKAQAYLNAECVKENHPDYIEVRVREVI